jgi:hypothetical protein
VLKATLLKKRPKLKKISKKESDSLNIEDIKVAIEIFNLKYKRVDEIDIYNIINYLDSYKKEHK